MAPSTGQHSRNNGFCGFLFTTALTSSGKKTKIHVYYMNAVNIHFEVNHMTKVFIDGSAGTTGLRIYERLSGRSDIELISLPEALRKDPDARQKAMNGADIVFLCLPDAAAKEALTLISNPDTAVIDTSTAHRTSDGWSYGFPELHGQREEIRRSKRIANPGCHATGFISLVRPLTEMGVLPSDALLSCFSLTGYSGGGKGMIADYEGAEKTSEMASPGIYALGQGHKHLPEMSKLCGLDNYPVFCPIVDDYYSGMATTVSLHMSQLKGIESLEEVLKLFAGYYADEKLITVAECFNSSDKYYGASASGLDSLRIHIAGNDERITLTAVFDNLGKGASGAAIQNMNILLGLPEETGLNL